LKQGQSHLALLQPFDVTGLFGFLELIKRWWWKEDDGIFNQRLCF